MDVPPAIPTKQHSPAQSSTLQVNFSWKKFKALITEQDNPSNPVYVVHFKPLKSPQIEIKSGTDDSSIGNGTFSTFSIDAHFEIRGQKGTLKALKRFKTVYTHLSRAFSDNDSPVTMTWNKSSGLKTWDFVCLDEQQMPVARLSANVWAAEKLGKIEFLGPKATSAAVRDEIVVTALTLFYCTAHRSSSILNFFGAMFARPGPLGKDGPAETHLEGGRSNNQGDSLD